MSITDTHEPAPVPNDRPALWQKVIADMQARDDFGRAKYGTPLQAFNGRDALVDAYQEALDLSVYLKQEIEENLNPILRGLYFLMRDIRHDNERWWTDLETGQPIDRNVGELIALAHSELSEALEGHRKSLMDDHLPHREMFVVELADAVIRILDTASHLAPEFPEVLLEKLAYNRKRADHKPENRRLANGEKY